MFLMLVGLGMIIVGASLMQRAGRMGAPSGPRPAPARPAPRPGGKPMTKPASGKPGQFAGVRLGQKLTYNHPERGGLTGIVLGTIEYAELWQKRKSPSEPWVPTGNRFFAHWLGDTLLYQWKDALYLLDSYDAITDPEIAQQILPSAKAFAQSDETAEVSFAYPPASWTIFDIGKYHVERADGEGLRLQPGATGRFLHARGGSGNEGHVLVVEDYLEGGGGQDTVWRGFRLTWDDLTRIE